MEEVWGMGGGGCNNKRAEEVTHRPRMSSLLFSATCIGPLGMESGAIKDDDISASSSFEHASVGPHNAR